MYLAEFVIQYALEEMNGQEKRVPSIDDLNRYFAGCGGPWKSFDNNTSWCGIFAAYILRKAGVQAQWVIGKGLKDLSGGADIKKIDGHQGIAPGDIAVRKGWEGHHFIVLNPVETGIINCVEGNYGGVGNPVLHHGFNWKNTAENVLQYYRVY